MEGMFAYSTLSGSAEDPKKVVEQIIREKRRLKVCSLSHTFNSHLLWAHYASGFDGLAIEVEIPDHREQVKRIVYRNLFTGVSICHVSDPERTARQILSSKHREWAYEQEVRVLHEGEWFPLTLPVQRIIVGHRMQPALFEALRIVCHHKAIRLCRTGIGDEGIDADVVPWSE